MAKTQIKKAPVQAEQTVFALDIGTRSIIGMAGTVEEGKVKILAIEREEHTERAMVDGQIENIEKVSLLADKVKKRLEDRLDIRLKRVCVAAAGRALRTRRSDFEMELPGTQLIDEEVISRLEAGAISRAEEAFNAENEAQGESRRFYLAGYTVCQYYLDQYAMSSLMDHRGRQLKVELIATFLPSEVVESLYTTMNKIGLEVASITLEPIAAINAAIPENLRLLNLVLVDIGAGTSDIAACTGGSVTGYTMATVAGDEVTEALMKEYLVDFATAEKIKAQADQEKEITFTDILGVEQKIGQEEIFNSIQGISAVLCKEIAEKVVEVNGGPPSALFLAGGGSKLTCLKDSLAAALGMDAKRVAIAGNYFQASAFSDEYDLNNPEYATPLGIVVSAGLNMINDSFRVTLNGKPAKLFRSGSFTALNLLMMNGYSFRDIMGRPGTNVAVTVNGQRKVFYGIPSEPASLLVNGREGKLSQIIHPGDSIEFVAAKAGMAAEPCLGDIEGAADCQEILLNGEYAFLETPLKNGDVVHIRRQEAEGQKPGEEPEKIKPDKEETIKPAAQEQAEEEAQKEAARRQAEEEAQREAVRRKAEEEAARRQEEEAQREAARRQAEEEAKREAARRQAEEEAQREAARRQAEEEAQREAARRQAEEEAQREAARRQKEEEIRAARKRALMVRFQLNGSPIRLPQKKDGSPYYLMDMIQYSGLDLKNPQGSVSLTVNGLPGSFQQELKENDVIVIEVEKR